VEKLPLILLSLRTAIKEDLGYSCAELMYGNNLRLPSDLIITNTNPTLLNLGTYSDRLKLFMNTVGPANSRIQDSGRNYIDSKLQTASHVFIRTDAVKGPLQQPYRGPYKVLARAEKYYTVQLEHKTDTINIGRLKAAHSEDDLIIPITPRATVELQYNAPQAVATGGASPGRDVGMDMPIPQRTTKPARNQGRRRPAIVVKEIQKKPYKTKHGRQVRAPTRYRN
jgi:hypothetical protein